MQDVFSERPSLSFSEIKRALDGKLKEFSFEPASDFNVQQSISVIDLDLLISTVFPLMEATLRREIKPGSALKIQVLFKLSLRKFLFDTEEERWVSAWFVSSNFLVLTPNQISSGLVRAFREILRSFDTFVQEGSGWTLDHVEDILLRLTKFSMFYGGCLREQLPSSLQSCRGIIKPLNAPNKGNECFCYAVTLALTFPSKIEKKQKINRLSSLDFRLAKLIFTLLGKPSSPVTLKDLIEFEKKVPFSISVFGFEAVDPQNRRKSFFPYYISYFLEKRKNHINLLLHKNHYYAISNLSSLVKKNLRKNSRKTFVCNFCLSTFVSQSAFEIHKSLCNKDGYHYQLPAEKKFMQFKNFSHLFLLPFVIYVDLESSMDPIRVNEANDKKKQFSKTDHRCISWASVTVCRQNEAFNGPPVVYTGKDPIESLLHFLKQEVLRIEQILISCNAPLVMSEEEEFDFLSSTFCKCCLRDFDDALHCKVCDHCHLSGCYRSALCDHCNFTYGKTTTKVVAFFHGLGNYDSHFIIKELHRFSDLDIRIIPKTSEKYLSFSIRNIHFKDSYQFLADKLEVLVKNLKDKGLQNFKLIQKYIKDESRRSLMFQKGVFPYSYITSLEILEQKSLPSKEFFFNDLTQTPISDFEYEFAKNVWKIFDCKTLKDYLHVYLLADVLLLADVFENFRTNCYKDYGLDPSHYFSLPHFTFDAYLRKTHVSLELLSDIDMYLLFSRSIRGGLSMVSKRYSHANNCFFQESFDKTKPSSFLLYIDANNLYGKCMLQRLPYKDFNWVEPTEENVEKILSLPLDEDLDATKDLEGFLLEVDLDYPIELHDIHSDLPLAPVRRAVDYSELSPYSKFMCDKFNLKSSLNTEKLMTTLEKKERYVIYYKNLILYLKLGLKLKKVYKIISFKENFIMKDYISFNSEKRAAATNSFDINFYKFLSNSLFGKTMERPENKTVVRLVNDLKSYENYVKRLNFKQAKIIHENLVSVEMKKPVFIINKPFYIGAIILELAKFHMYSFHYNVMKNFFKDKIQLIYTDTDSFIYEIFSEDLHQDLKQIENFFDFSNYPTDHFLFSTLNKKVPGKFKDETASNMIKEFVGLRSKMYCFSVDEKKELKEFKTAKGVKKYVIEKDLKLQQYKKVLFENVQLEHEFRNIKSERHQVFTSHEKKISLSPFDDKRFLLDSVNSLPYGHYRI